MTKVNHDVVTDLVGAIEWPAEWGEENKEDFLVWVKNSMLQTPGYKHIKMLEELLAKLVEIEQASSSKEAV